MANNFILVGRTVDKPKEYNLKKKDGSDFIKATVVLAIDDGFGDNKKTDFPRLTLFGKNAERAVKYLEKGRLVYVRGKIGTSSYEKDGEKVYSTDLIVGNDYKDLEFLGSKRDAAKKEEEIATSAKAAEATEAEDSFEQADEDIPF